MKKLLAPAALFAAVMMAISCGKNSDKPATTLSQIQAKWNLTSINLHAVLFDSTYNGAAGDYFDFRTDGNMYSSVDGENDTTAYSLLSNNQLLLGGDTAAIKQLSSSQFVFEKDTLIETIPVEITFSLNK